jgi:methyl-accepting chemotaxis protein
MNLNQFINNLSFRNKMIVIISPLILVILFLFFLLVFQNYSTIISSRNALYLINLSTHLSALIHNLQKERGSSNGYISSAGKNFKETLTSIRSDTDKSFQDLIKFVDDNPEIIIKLKIKDKIEDIKNYRNQLDNTRAKVNRLNITTEESFQFYSDFIAFQLEIIHLIKNRVEDYYLSNLVLSFYDFLYFKEYAGKERAFLSAIFSLKKFPKIQYKNYMIILNTQNLFKKLYLDNIREIDPLKEIYTRNINKDLEQKVENLRNIALEERWEEDINPEEWFKISTERIDNLKQIEDEIRNFILKESKNRYNKSLIISITMFLLILIFLIISFYITFIINRNLHIRIHYLQNIFTKIKDGDLSLEIITTSENDEIAKITNMLMNFIDSFKKVLINIKESFSKIDLTSQKLVEISHQLNQISDNIKQFTQHLASSSEEMTNNLNVIASSIEEITITLNEVSKNAEEIVIKSNDVKNVINNSNQILENLIESTKGIEKTTELISDMAQQTNLLALNAAIEAANAGDKGAGFAVVASEVKELANKTKNELININQNIKNLQEKVQQTNNIFIAINENFNELNQFTQSIGASFQEQSTAIKEISININQNLQAIEEVNKGINQLDSMVSNEDKQIEEINTLIKELKEHSIILRDILAQYKNY